MLTLVTGTTGQVGRRFVPRLLAQRQPDEQIRVLVRDEARGEPLAQLGAQVAVGDMRDEGTLGKALAGVDAVVNVAAAFRGVPDEEAWAVNRDAAVALGRAARTSGVQRFVQVSTNNVYGVGRGRPRLRGGVSFDDGRGRGGCITVRIPRRNLPVEIERRGVEAVYGAIRVGRERRRGLLELNRA